jgi:DNA topoisomerase-1
MKIVVVESPAKCSKIQSYLGDGYRVQATMGHIRALEEKLTAVGIDRGWEPTYMELSAKKDAISKLRTAAKGAEVILATDDDREGEGIAWHVCVLLKLNPATTPRIVFHEITAPAIRAAVAAPRLLDMNKVSAQQARSMLDLLVGFTISKVLWNRVAPKLSAGRCQTPALRLVAERDAEVERHTAQAFWKLHGDWKHPSHPALRPLAADTADVENQVAATRVLNAVYAKPNSKILTVKESVSTSQPPKPFITSTLQQEASACHGLSPKTTMQAAQKLYEAGHITYMRTDNPQIAEEAAAVVRAYITTNYGKEYVGSEGQHILNAEVPAKKTKKSPSPAPDVPAAQAAHEAIRPTHPETPNPDISDAIQRTVYNLIWRRTTQCQMSPALTDIRRATLCIEADPSRVWTAEQSKVAFYGWRRLERVNEEEAASDTQSWAAWAPLLTVGATLLWNRLNADEAFTKPKGRYTEASLIAELEHRGIGRPSTFASLVSTIVDRDYVEKTNVDGKSQDSHHLQIVPHQWPPTASTTSHKVGAEKNKLRSTALGRSVVDFLVREYADLFNYEFTAAMERDLDGIAQGTKPWKSLLQTTWDTYKDRYTTMTTGTSTASKATRERILAEGVKVILSRKGPLFVRDPPAGSPKTVKATFAPLLPSTTFETATASDADRAFAAAAEARTGELLGMLETAEIRKKKGPYGFYAECGATRIPLKGGESLEDIQDKLKAKISFATTETAYTRTLGDFTIKRGPYGLYFYKHTLKRVSFIKFPPTLEPDTVTLADLTGLYSAGLAKKRRPFKKKTDESK